MQSLLVPAKDTELYHFTGTGKDKQFMIFNGGIFPCSSQTVGMTSSISISVSFERKEMVILGTQYAGEMKKVSMPFRFGSILENVVFNEDSALPGLAPAQADRLACLRCHWRPPADLQVDARPGHVPLRLWVHHQSRWH